MTKPSKSKASKNSADAQAEKSKETLKLKKDAAEPGTVAASDVGAGKGESAAAKGGTTTPVDSNLVGESSDKRIAAQPKTKPDTIAPTKAGADRPGSDHDAKDARGGVPPVDARKSSEEKAETAVKAENSKPAAASQRSATERKSGFWPVAFGGVVAAGMGAAATIWALPNLPAGWLPEQTETVDAEAIRLEAVTAAKTAAEEAIANAPAEEIALPEDLQTTLNDHAARIAALEKSVSTEPASQEASPGSGRSGDAGNASLVPAEESGDVSSEDLQALTKQLEEQAAKIAELESRPSIGPEAAKKIQSLAKDADAVQQKISSTAAKVQKQLDAVQQKAAKLQEEAAASTKRAQAVAAVAALQTALDKGVTAEESRQALAETGIDTPEALQKDIPSLDSLQTGFGNASRAALRATMTDADSSGEGGNAFTNFLKAQTGARSVAPREGNDPDAVLSRANAHVESGDIAAALSEIEALPESALGAPAMAEWLAGAQAYNDAQAALSDLSESTN